MEATQASSAEFEQVISLIELSMSTLLPYVHKWIAANTGILSTVGS